MYRSCVSSLTSSRLWPPVPEFSSFINSSSSVFHYSLEGREWTFLRNACLHQNKNQLILIDSNDIAKVQFLSESLSLILTLETQYSFQIDSMTLSNLLTHPFVTYNDSIPWLLPLSGDVESVVQSIASIFSIIQHPDLYPPVSMIFSHYR